MVYETVYSFFDYAPNDAFSGHDEAPSGQLGLLVGTSHEAIGFDRVNDFDAKARRLGNH